jgi:hypothetical protein
MTFSAHGLLNKRLESVLFGDISYDSITATNIQRHISGKYVRRLGSNRSSCDSREASLLRLSRALMV